MRNFRVARTGWVAAMLLLLVAGDQLTKLLAVKYLSAGPPVSLFNDVLRFEYIENRGGFLGFLNGLPEDIRTILLTFCVAALLLAGLAFVVCSSRLSRSTLALVTLVLGGGIGNLIDRLVNAGGVIDFVSVGIGWLRTGIFNVADVYIFFGSFALGVIVAMGERKKD